MRACEKVIGQDLQGIFQTFFLEHYRDVVRFACFYTGDLAVAEDLVQDAFIQLWVRGKEADHTDGLKNYLLLSVKNRCLNYLRHRQVRELHLLQNAGQDFVEYTDPEEETLEEAFRKALGKMPAKRRKTLELCVLETKSYREVADLLGISPNTVKDHLKKAYAFLREEMKDPFYPLRKFSRTDGTNEK